MFGDLKKKFVALPTLNKNEPQFPLQVNPQMGYFSSGEQPFIHQIKNHANYQPNVEENFKSNPSQSNSSSHQDGDYYGEDPVQDRHSHVSCDSRDSCRSGAKTSRPKAFDAHESEERLSCRSRAPSREGNRRSISSEGRLTCVREERKLFCHDARSNSLDRHCHDKHISRGDSIHSSGCRCYKCVDRKDESCSVCKSCNHKSWCERNHHSSNFRSSQPASHHNSRHSQKSSSQTDSRSTEILKDIAPVKRVPSPIHDPRRSDQETLHTELVQPTLKSHCPPLSSRRLRATRQESKNAILNILDDGQVCVEFLHVKKNQKRVKDVCRISPDGLRIALYQPNGSFGTLIAEAPPPIPNEGADFIFSYDNLPQKFWKKYIYAARFIQLVRERTPKITYYSEQAQCILMENSPNADFVVKFYSGEKLLFSAEKVELTEANGRQMSITAERVSTHFGTEIRVLFEHAVEVKQHCITLEEILTQLENAKGFPSFPVVIGKRPPTSTSSAPLRSKEYDKENVSPASVQSVRPQNEVAQLGAYEGSVGGSIASVSSKFRRPLTPSPDTLQPTNRNHPQKMFVDNVGCLSQNGDEMILKFLDGTCLQMNAYQPSEYVYTDSSNVRRSYLLNSSNIPVSLREKLCQFQKALVKMKPGRSCSNSLSKQPSHPHKNTMGRATTSSTLPRYIR